MILPPLVFLAEAYQNSTLSIILFAYATVVYYLQERLGAYLSVESSKGLNLGRLQPSPQILD